MKYNRNQKINQVTEATLVIGVDIAKKKTCSKGPGLQRH